MSLVHCVLMPVSFEKSGDEPRLDPHWSVEDLIWFLPKFFFVWSVHTLLVSRRGAGRPNTDQRGVALCRMARRGAARRGAGTVLLGLGKVLHVFTYRCKSHGNVYPRCDDEFQNENNRIHPHWSSCNSQTHVSNLFTFSSFEYIKVFYYINSKVMIRENRLFF